MFLPPGPMRAPILSTGIYRIPYVDGTVVGVTNDSHGHNNAYDMGAGQGSEIEIGRAHV